MVIREGPNEAALATNCRVNYLRLSSRCQSAEHHGERESTEEPDPKKNELARGTYRPAFVVPELREWHGSACTSC